MKKLNKKGFTLVELLAVVVVLALLALLAVNAVGNALEKSRKNAFRTDALNLIKAAEDQYGLDSLEGTSTGTYTCADLVSKGTLSSVKNYDECSISITNDGTKLTTTITLKDSSYQIESKTKEDISKITDVMKDTTVITKVS